MRPLEFWKAVVVDDANMLERLVGLLEEERVAYCVVGGQAVNAYVDPLVSMDLDLVVAADDLGRLEPLLREAFRVETFPHSLNLSHPGSSLRAQIQKDPRYLAFIQGATRREVLGIPLPVASLRDVMRGKVWAAQDPERRPSKRQKDLADISRILEAYPDLRGDVPAEILHRLL